MKICFLMPTYLPHFDRAISFLESHKKNKLDQQSDVCFVFSNKQEESDFEKLSYSKSYHSIVLPSHLIRGRDSIIGVKKIYALNKIYQNYQYIIMLDSESLIIKNIDLLKMCEEFYRNKVLYGNQALANPALVNGCLEPFTQCKNLKSINKELYLWFNQICIYKSEFVPHFFEITNINEFSLKYMNFEYYIYMFYLLLYRNFYVKDIGVASRYGFFEEGVFVPKSNLYLTLKPYHCCPNLYPFIDTTNVFLFIQVDRNRTFEWFEPSLENYRPKSADLRVKQSLSYQLGAIIENIKFWEAFMLPVRLRNVVKKHQDIRDKYEAYKILKPHLKLPLLQTYEDYEEGIKCKESLTYKIGSALIRANSSGGGGIFLFLLKVLLFKLGYHKIFGIAYQKK